MKERKVITAPGWVLRTLSDGQTSAVNKPLGITVSVHSGLLWIDADNPASMTALPLVVIQELLR